MKNDGSRASRRLRAVCLFMAAMLAAFAVPLTIGHLTDARGFRSRHGLPPLCLPSTGGRPGVGPHTKWRSFLGSHLARGPTSSARRGSIERIR